MLARRAADRARDRAPSAAAPRGSAGCRTRAACPPSRWRPRPLCVAGLVAGGLAENAQGSESAASTASRYASVSSVRYEYWRVGAAGVHARARPRAWAPAGSGSSGARSGASRTRSPRCTRCRSRWPPSSGCPGCCCSGVRRRRRGWPACRALRQGAPLAPGATAVCAAWLLHATIDWDWQLPAVTLPALVLAGGLLAASEERLPGAAPADWVPAPRPPSGRSPSRRVTSETLMGCFGVGGASKVSGRAGARSVGCPGAGAATLRRRRRAPAARSRRSSRPSRSGCSSPGPRPRGRRAAASTRCRRGTGLPGTRRRRSRRGLAPSRGQVVDDAVAAGCAPPRRARSGDRRLNATTRGHGRRRRRPSAARRGCGAAAGARTKQRPDRPAEHEPDEHARYRRPAERVVERVDRLAGSRRDIDGHRGQQGAGRAPRRATTSCLRRRIAASTIAASPASASSAETIATPARPGADVADSLERPARAPQPPGGNPDRVHDRVRARP